MLLAAHAGTRRALCTLAGTWEQMRTKILRALGEMMVGPLGGHALGDPSNSIIVSRVPVRPKNLKRLALSVRLKLNSVNCIVNGKPSKTSKTSNALSVRLKVTISKKSQSSSLHCKFLATKNCFIMAAEMRFKN